MSGTVSDATELPRARPTGFEYVPGNIFGCVNSGRAEHDVDLEKEFRATYINEIGSMSELSGPQDSWVDPINGSDSSVGSLSAPYKTLKFAYQNASGTVWLLPGRYTEKLDLRNTDRQLPSGQSRAMMIKVWGSPGAVVFVGKGDQASEMTWVSGDTQLWQATPSGGESVSLILYIGDSTEIPIQYKTSASEVDLVGYGWFQDPVTKLISVRYADKDLSVDKAKFEILYGTPGSSIVYGAKTYLQGIKFRGGGQIDVVYQDAVRPVLYAKDCTFEYLAGSNLHTEGAICFTQNCTSRRALVNDGFNYYDGPDETPTLALEVDNLGIDNGVPECESFVKYPFNQSRNKQGSSGHESSIVCRINGEYAGNYGQNIADNGSNSRTWMVGSILGSPRQILSEDAIPMGYPSLRTEGIVWLDTVTSGGSFATLGLYVKSGTCRIYRCSFSGTTAKVLKESDATIINYDPWQT